LDSRSFLRALYRAAVSAVEPGRLVAEALARRGNAVVVRSVSDPGRREFVFVPRRVVLLSVGRAAPAMASAAHRALGTLVTESVVIAPAGTPEESLPPGCRFLPAAHPVPDERSLAAGREALALAASLRSEDLLVVLLSGGASSLMACPIEEVSLAEKALTASLLAAAGAPAADVNLVRGALSRVKAGRLAAAARAADVVTLVLSDLGDAGWHLVGSGPTLGVAPSRRDAVAILDTWRLLSLVPPAVRACLLSPHSENPPRDGGQRWSVLLGDIRTALEGARREALRLGADVRTLPDLLEGEARWAARRLAVAGACAGNLVRRAGAPQRRVVTLFGGETTVTVKGDGKGGRSRELALATAFHVDGVRGASLLVAGTDGVDNTPDAAGAFVDDTTLSRAAALGLDAAAALERNDSGTFFAALGDAFSPGPTGTSVGEVAFVLAPGGEPFPAAPDPEEEGIPLPDRI
jgi:hydroxypyruvate reductase